MLKNDKQRTIKNHKKMTSSKELRLSARKASLNAQRTSRVLDIPYTIIQKGIIYTVHKNKQEVVGKVFRKVTPKITELKKGTKLYL